MNQPNINMKYAPFPLFNFNNRGNIVGVILFFDVVVI